MLPTTPKKPFRPQSRMGETNFRPKTPATAPMMQKMLVIAIGDVGKNVRCDQDRDDPPLFSQGGADAGDPSA